MEYKPTMQTKNGTKGNCLSACVASLYDVNIDEVYYAGDGNGDHEGLWVWDLSKWFKDRFNKYAMLVKLPRRDEITLFGGAKMITAIDSDCNGVDRHAVITQNGRVVFDPSIGEMDRELKDSENPTFILIGDII